jgi:hypothetical protein
MDASNSTPTPSNVPSPHYARLQNHLFAGSGRGANRWATVCSLITTAKLNDVEPFAYLEDEWTLTELRHSARLFRAFGKRSVFSLSSVD